MTDSNEEALEALQEFVAQAEDADWPQSDEHVAALFRRANDALDRIGDVFAVLDAAREVRNTTGEMINDLIDRKVLEPDDFRLGRCEVPPDATEHPRSFTTPHVRKRNCINWQPLPAYDQD